MARTGSSRSLAEQSERLLKQTARIFPNKPYTPGITKVLETVPRGKGTDVPEEPREQNIKLETTKEGGTRAEQPGRRKQKNPRKSGGFETTSTRCTSPRDGLGESRLGARQVVHRGVQCELLSSMGPPRTPTGAGGVTLSMIPPGDPRNTPRGCQWKESKRARMSVIRKNIWAKL